MVSVSTMLLIISIAISFFSTIILTKTWIRAARRFGLVGKDMNKLEKPDVAEGGGIAVLFGLLAGLFFYIFIVTFVFHSQRHLIDILALVSALLLAGFLGFIDDILGWKQGLKQWQKPLLMLPAAVPLMVTNLGHATMAVPVIGKINFGIIYPLVLIPVGIIGASNGFNMLAGMNGLEAGMGAIILSALACVAYLNNYSWVALIAALAVAGLLAFLLFNKFPARVFPGDSLTYSIGALIAALAILGDMEKIAVVLFIPYFLEFLLKARFWFKIDSFGQPLPDGTLSMPAKVGSLTHIFAKIFKTEKKTVHALLLMEVLLAGAAIIMS
ncbi:MAG: glycosyltransferase 4 family protein, partial [Nanoarchaeota archaeon]